MPTEYENAINNLIPTAAAFADRHATPDLFQTHEAWADAWNILYHREMAKLASNAGLRNYPVRQGGNNAGIQG
jgi:hypothetical protein